ncbi:MAG: type II toxin-antitoxin system RelE/ParE family toxin [Planctomycetes bacterium]|nr:type II toxin-antitoxin system RelE/ParE family toxin [Planctomycetota bacterium]
MTDLVIHPAAQMEYAKAAEWYAERSTAAAHRFASEVEAAIQAICKQPDSYPLVDDRHRLYLVNGFPYYIAYRQLPGLLRIVAIRHAAQDQDAWKDR